MTRGIPPIPLDGETYSSAGVAGLPLVLEYDGPTGGYKLVVSTEAGVAINVSGTVEVTGGQLTVVGAAQYGEDTPHASGNTGTFTMGIRNDSLSSLVDADGDYAGLQLDYLGRLRSHIEGQAVQITGSFTPGDAVSNPSGLPQVAVYNMLWNQGESEWARQVMFDYGDGLNPSGRVYTLTNSFISARTHSVGAPITRDALRAGETNVPNAPANPAGILNVIASNYGFDNTTGSFRRINATSSGELHQTLASGSFPGQQQAQLLSDAIVNPHAGIVGGANLFWDIVGGNWERDPARQVNTDLAGGVFPQRASFSLFYDYDVGTWQRIYGGDLGADSIDGFGAGSSLDNAINARAAIVMNVGNFQYDIARGSIERGLHTTMISGSFPGQDGSQLLDDTVANPYAGLIGGMGMSYDYGLGTWFRNPGENWIVFQSQAPRISATLQLPQVWAHGVMNSLGTATMYPLQSDVQRRLMVSALVTGTVSTELSAAVTLAEGMANPTVPQVGGMGMSYDNILGTWFRNPGDGWRVFQSQAPRIDSTLQLPQVWSHGVMNLLGEANMFPQFCDITRRLMTSAYVTGTVGTELAAAVALADGMANPTVPQVGSMNMAYNGATWDRLYMGISGSLAVDMVSQLDAINDEITAYVTGTVHAIIDSGNVGLRNQLLAPQYVEDAAHVSGATGSFPLAVRQDALASLVNADGDYAPFQVDSLGRLKSRVYGSVSITGTASVELVTGSVVGIGGITKVIRREVVNISGSGGEFELIAANGSNRLKVTSMMLIADADTNVHFQSGWTGTAVTGPMSLPSDGDGFFLNTPSTPDQFHFESEPGENLVLDQSAAAAIGGWIQYYTEA